MAEKKEEFALLQYLDDLVQELCALAGPAITGIDAAAVHDARVATRRLKAAIELFKPLVSGRHRKPVQKIGRLLRRRLGALRDLDVILDHLAHVKSSHLRPAVRWMTDRAQKHRQKSLAQAAEDLPTAYVLSKLGSWWGLSEEITAAKDAAASLLAESLHAQMDAFADSASAQIQKAPGHDSHQLRIAAKSLRYTLEMAHAHGLTLPPPVLPAFKRIQKALGLWHDYAVLANRILLESQHDELALHDIPCQQNLLALATVMLRRADHQLTKVAQLWHRDGPDLIAQLRHAFPLVKTAPPPPLEPTPVPGPLA